MFVWPVPSQSGDRSRLSTGVSGRTLPSGLLLRLRTWFAVRALMRRSLAATAGPAIPPLLCVRPSSSRLVDVGD